MMMRKMMTVGLQSPNHRINDLPENPRIPAGKADCSYYLNAFIHYQCASKSLHEGEEISEQDSVTQVLDQAMANGLGVWDREKIRVPLLIEGLRLGKAI